MVIKSFEATVAGGRLEHEELPDEFEGRRVHVTVTIEDAEGEERSDANFNGSEEDGPEPPEWLDVEIDVYVRMPAMEVTLNDVKVIDLGPAPPCIILPEELPDD